MKEPPSRGASIYGSSALVDKESRYKEFGRKEILSAQNTTGRWNSGERKGGIDAIVNSEIHV